MASILDISDTFLENFVDELSHPEHAAHPNVGFNIEEENMCKDLLDALNSLASPAISPFNVAANHVVGQNFSVLGYTNCDTDDISYIMEAKQAVPELTSQAVQNLDGLGYINYESGWSSSNIYCNVVGGSVMRAEQAAPDMSSCNFSWNDGGDAMQAEQEVPLDITSEVCQNSDSLGCVNYDSGWSSSNVSCSGTTKLNSLCDPTLKRKKCCNSALGDQIPPVLTLHARLDRKRKNSVNESNASASGAPAPKKQNCEPDVDFALANRQLEEVLSNERTTTPLHSINQTENASQFQVQLIGKNSEIPLKNASRGRRDESTDYPCAECGKQFKRKSYLTQHSRTHTGEKPYKCTECDFVCSHASGLSKHKRTHSDARPFKCSICNAAFKFKHVLTGHQVTHSGGRLYECNLCDETFPLRSGLISHIKSH